MEEVGTQFCRLIGPVTVPSEAGVCGLERGNAKRDSCIIGVIMRSSYSGRRFSCLEVVLLALFPSPRNSISCLQQHPYKRTPIYRRLFRVAIPGHSRIEQNGLGRRGAKRNGCSDNQRDILALRVKGLA
jgi:hypothetical protein